MKNGKGWFYIRGGGGGGSEGPPFLFAYTDPAPSKLCCDPSSSGALPSPYQALVLSSLRDPPDQLPELAPHHMVEPLLFS